MLEILKLILSGFSGRRARVTSAAVVVLLFGFIYAGFNLVRWSVESDRQRIVDQVAQSAEQLKRLEQQSAIIRRDVEWIKYALAEHEKRTEGRSIRPPPTPLDDSPADGSKPDRSH